MWSRVFNVFFTLQFLKFLFTSGLAALLHWFSRMIFSQWMVFSLAVFLAYIMGMSVAFVLNSIFIFPTSTKPWNQQAQGFVLVSLAFLPLVWLISMSCEHFFRVHEVTSYPEAFAHAVGIACPTLLTFLIYKFFTFEDVKHEQ